MVMHACKDIDHLPLLRASVPGAVCCYCRNSHSACHVQDVLIARFLIAMHVPLKLAVCALLSEDQECRFERRPAFSASQTDKAFRELRDLFRGGRALAFL